MFFAPEMIASPRRAPCTVKAWVIERALLAPVLLCVVTVGKRSVLGIDVLQLHGGEAA